MGLPLALVVVLAAAPPAARGADAPAIVWQAPAGCPGEAELRAQVDALLVGAPAGVGRDIAIDLRVEPLADGRWRLDASMRGPDLAGRRSLEAGRCAELVEAAALLTAIAVYPELAAAAEPLVPAAPSAVEPSPGSAAPPAVEPSTGPADPVPPAPESHVSSNMSATTSAESAPAAPPRPALRWPLALAAGPGFGAIPGVSPLLLKFSAGVRGRRWSVVLGQTFWLPRDLPAPADPAVGGRLWLWAAGLRACGIPGRGRLEFPLCGGVEAGVLTGRGIGELVSAQRVTSAWVALSAGPGLAVRLAPRLALTLGVDVLVMLAYPRLQIPGRGTVCCAAPVGALATAGLELRLGRTDPGQRF